MSREEAFKVLQAMDRDSLDDFSEDEREAIVLLSASSIMGLLTDQEAAEWKIICGKYEGETS